MAWCYQPAFVDLGWLGVLLDLVLSLGLGVLGGLVGVLSAFFVTAVVAGPALAGIRNRSWALGLLGTVWAGLSIRTLMAVLPELLVRSPLAVFPAVVRCDTGSPLPSLFTVAHMAPMFITIAGACVGAAGALVLIVRIRR